MLLSIVKTIVDFRMVKGILIDTSFVEKKTFHVVKYSIVKQSFLY